MAFCKPVEIVSIVSEAKSVGPKTPPQLLLPLLYGLNRSISKKIYFGIEIKDSGFAEVAIRLIGADYVGIRFNTTTWANFLGTFELVNKFFASGRNSREMLDQKLIGCGFSVRFVISHKEKAIEIEEDVAKESGVKKHRRSVILKENTFAILQHYLPLLESRLAHYGKLVSSFNFVMTEVVRQSRNNEGEGKKRLERPDMPLLGDPDFTEDDFQRVWSQIVSDENVPDISMDEVKIMYNEILHLRFNCNNYGLSIPEEYQ